MGRQKDLECRCQPVHAKCNKSTEAGNDAVPGWGEKERGERGGEKDKGRGDVDVRLIRHETEMGRIIVALL